jgi:hypothetical protein
MDLKAVISYFRRRRWILLAICIITPLGLGLWFYDGPARRWFNFYLTCSAYEIFWCLVVFFFWPRRENATRIALGVFLATCGLEVLQLWRPALLQQIRSTFLGMAIIGTDFVWRQFPYYVAGSGIGWMLMRLLCGEEAGRN